MIRYADKFVTLCRSEAEARAALAEAQVWVSSTGLHLHPTKTRIVETTKAGGFDFLGYHFKRCSRWPRAKSMKKFKNTIRAKTRGTNGQSLPAIVTELSRILQG
jgi:RNA-directed DNA polymerase